MILINRYYEVTAAYSMDTKAQTNVDEITGCVGRVVRLLSEGDVEIELYRDGKFVGEYFVSERRLLEVAGQPAMQELEVIASGHGDGRKVVIAEGTGAIRFRATLYRSDVVQDELYFFSAEGARNWAASELKISV